jgi:DNA repair photolyase
MQTIYEPKGRAGEYCELVLNIYPSCNHGCTYCWANDMRKRWGKDSPDTFTARPGLLPALEKELAKGKYAGRTIWLCDSCDPYPAPPVDTTITREVIKLLKTAGCHVQILTKGGSRAERDFDLLDGQDWFGVTITGDEKQEPGAASEFERIASLWHAHSLGIQTWISHEPVYNQETVYTSIEHGNWIDLLRIGKLNYRPSPINWGDFGRECERRAELHGRKIYIKDDLRKEMGL